MRENEKNNSCSLLLPIVISGQIHERRKVPDNDINCFNYNTNQDKGSNQPTSLHSILLVTINQCKG